jgi:hypothetical protein
LTTLRKVYCKLNVLPLFRLVPCSWGSGPCRVGNLNRG